MGQYYLVVNLDKREFLHAHKLGDGLKLMEFGNSSDGTMLALPRMPRVISLSWRPRMALRVFLN